MERTRLLSPEEAIEMEGDGRCQGCGQEVGEEELILHEGERLCEECYFDRCHRIKVCDPWGERSKRVFREMAGLEGTEGLTEVQAKIYELIRSRDGASPEEIGREFGLSPAEVQNEFAILRHCQLVKGKRAEGKMLFVPW